MTIFDHFEELRNRLFIGLGGWVVAAGIAFAFRFDLLEWLQAPLPPAMTLAYFSVLEPFVASMQIASFFGLVLAAPLIVGQVWGFISSALYVEERRYAAPFIVMAAFAFAGGVAFSYWVVLPFTLPIAPARPARSFGRGSPRTRPPPSPPRSGRTEDNVRRQQLSPMAAA